jgi:cysteinyl-tRNA synthetase
MVSIFPQSIFCAMLSHLLGQLLKKLGGYIGILQMEGDVFLKHTSQGSTEKRGVGLSDTQIDAKI